MYTKLSLLLSLSLSLFRLSGVLAQQVSCENYGTPNGSSCACPVGFGGSTCSQPGCGGDIFQGASRNLAPGNSTSFANLTSSGCSTTCETGWGGFGCNVCQTSSACQSAFSAVGGSSAGSDDIGLNNTLVCNNEPKVEAAGQMSCSVVNPTLQSIFPGSSNLNILRTLSPNQTPLPNVTGFGSAGSIYAQLWYESVEQFYCAADSCTQSVSDSGDTDWQCSNLKCTCRTNTTFCGGGSVNLAETIDGLDGSLTISCAEPSDGSSTTTCGFQQTILNQLFGSSGLSLSDCLFGECVAQSVIDSSSSSSSTVESTRKSLSAGVIAGLAVVGALLFLAVVFIVYGLVLQRRARKGIVNGFSDNTGGIQITWKNVSYAIPRSNGFSSSVPFFFSFSRKRKWNGGGGGGGGGGDEKVILDNVSGQVRPGEMMAILGPSGAGKTTLIEILAGKQKSGQVSGTISRSFSLTNTTRSPRIAFVPQQDVLPSMLTVREALTFAASLRLPESVSAQEKRMRVDEVIEQLGLSRVAHTQIGSSTGSSSSSGGGGGGSSSGSGGGSGGGGARGISGGEMRRVSIGLELVGRPDAIILDEPTSGLDSVSASRVMDVLRSVAKDVEHPVAVLASIHQPSLKLYHSFDKVMVLSAGGFDSGSAASGGAGAGGGGGRALYSGTGGLDPVRYFVANGVEEPMEGYNVAEYLLDIASDPPTRLYQNAQTGQIDVDSPKELFAFESEKSMNGSGGKGGGVVPTSELEKGVTLSLESNTKSRSKTKSKNRKNQYATSFLTQFEVLSNREWKILCRDKTLFLTHLGVASVLGVFCGGLYFNTGTTIAGFQSRVGCLFFLGALVAFSSLSALYNLVESRPLFVRERSNLYYSPTAWLLSRLVFDVVPLRLIPTIIVSTITYWMAGLASDPAHFFKFLFILVLYSLAMTLFNFLLACLFRNGGIAILLSALTALYQMTFAGFFVHLSDIPPVLRWLQWLCPLKYTLEALSVNEVGAGLMIEDTLQGVPVDVSASLIMQLLFGFGVNNYYRDVLVLFAFIAGFGVGVIGIVWFRVRERR